MEREGGQAPARGYLEAAWHLFPWWDEGWPEGNPKVNLENMDDATAAVPKKQPAKRADGIKMLRIT